MKIYIARHGQTDWNMELRMQGHTDIPLNETGLAQAEMLAERFKHIPIDKIFSSDLCRASETANIINKHHNVEIILDEGLREVSYGHLEGRLASEVADQLTEVRRNCKAMPGGEEPDAFLERIRSSMDKVTAESAENILVVAHGCAIRAIECYFLGLSKDCLFVWGVGNTAVYCFERSGDSTVFNMIIENDTSHLGGGS